MNKKYLLFKKNAVYLTQIYHLQSSVKAILICFIFLGIPKYN